MLFFPCLLTYLSMPLPCPKSTPFLSEPFLWQSSIQPSFFFFFAFGVLYIQQSLSNPKWQLDPQAISNLQFPPPIIFELGLLINIPRTLSTEIRFLCSRAPQISSHSFYSFSGFQEKRNTNAMEHKGRPSKCDNIAIFSSSE